MEPEPELSLADQVAEQAEFIVNNRCPTSGPLDGRLGLVLQGVLHVSNVLNFVPRSAVSCASGKPDPFSG